MRGAPRPALRPAPRPAPQRGGAASWAPPLVQRQRETPGQPPERQLLPPGTLAPGTDAARAAPFLGCVVDVVAAPGAAGAAARAARSAACAVAAAGAAAFAAAATLAAHRRLAETTRITRDRDLVEASGEGAVAVGA